MEIKKDSPKRPMDQRRNTIKNLEKNKMKTQYIKLIG